MIYQIVSLTLLLSLAASSASAEGQRSPAIARSLKVDLSRASSLLWNSKRSSEEEVELTILRLKLEQIPLNSPEISIQAMPNRFSTTTPLSVLQKILKSIDESLSESANVDRIARAYLEHQGYLWTGDNGDINDLLIKLSKLTSYALSKGASDFDARLILSRLNLFRYIPPVPAASRPKFEIISSLAENAQRAILLRLESPRRAQPVSPRTDQARALLDSVIEESKMIFSGPVILTWSEELERIAFDFNFPAETRQIAFTMLDGFHRRENNQQIARNVFSLDNIKEKLEFSVRLLERIEWPITSQLATKLEALVGCIIFWKTGLFTQPDAESMEKVNQLLGELAPVLDHQRERLKLPKSFKEEGFDAFLASATSPETISAYKRVYSAGQSVMVSIACTQMIARLHEGVTGGTFVNEALRKWITTLDAPEKLIDNAMNDFSEVPLDDVWPTVFTADERIHQIRKQSQLIISSSMVKEWIADLYVIQEDSACLASTRAQAKSLIEVLDSSAKVEQLRHSALSAHNLSWKLLTGVKLLQYEGLRRSDRVTAIIGSIMAWRAHLVRLGNRVPADGRVASRRLAECFKMIVDRVLINQRQQMGLWIPETTENLKPTDFERLEALKAAKIKVGGSRAMFRELYEDDSLAVIVHASSLVACYNYSKGGPPDADYVRRLFSMLVEYSIRFGADEDRLFEPSLFL